MNAANKKKVTVTKAQMVLNVGLFHAEYKISPERKKANPPKPKI